MPAAIDSPTVLHHHQPDRAGRSNPRPPPHPNPSRGGRGRADVFSEIVLAILSPLERSKTMLFSFEGLAVLLMVIFFIVFGIGNSLNP